MGKKLVIVESPAKAKTIQKFVGAGAVVKATFGHVRDLPKSTLGVSVEDDFEPKYVIPKKSNTVIKELKSAAKNAEVIYLATDPDREGEAIAWHVLQALDLDKSNAPSAYRIVFHEITESAVKKALEKPAGINENLVDAQQARRILDRLVGYELSPLLWKKIYRGLSAGRVQSAALRLIIDREAEIAAFKTTEYWSLWATFTAKKEQQFLAKLEKIGGKSLEKYPSEQKIKDAQKHDDKTGWAILDRVSEQRQRHPYPPFTTSTLQQEAARKLHFSAKQTMMIAQKLYEGISIGKETVGLITYMRTDSLNLASSAISEARSVIEKEFGKKYLPTAPRAYKTKSKGAQEAHEAIRPTSFARTPDSVKQYLSAQEQRLYDLIWKRAMACQMSSADVESTQIHVGLKANPTAVTYVARGLTIVFPGFLKLYEETRDEGDPEEASENQLLPDVDKGDTASLLNLEPKQHFTQPPPRFTEASLVKEMEKRGIGRPSTYAPTISTLADRGYVIKQENKLMPQEVGGIVINLLKEKFPSIVDLDFTAKLEEELDEVATGAKKWQPIVKEFYTPFKESVTNAEKEIDHKSLSETSTEEKCPDCDKPLIIKLGRFGKFYACTGFPDCRYTRPFETDGKEAERQEELVGDRKCPNDNADLVIKTGRFGTFIGCSNYPNCKFIEAINKEIGVKCPEDGGAVIERKTRRGKLFWGCANYPKCKFASWDKPVGDPCPSCKSLMVQKKNEVKCTKCDHTQALPTEQPAAEPAAA